MLTDLEPGSDPRLAAVFSAAKAPAELPVPGEAAALSAYRRLDGKSWLRTRLGARPAQLVAAALFGGLVVAGGAAAAATGSLPIVGSHTTHANHSQAPATTDSTAGDSTSGDETSSGTDLTDTGGPGTDGHPAVLGSVQKGIDTCTQASKGKCHAGQHGKALQAHDAHPAPTLPSAATTHRSTHAATAGGAASSHRHLVAGHVSSARLRTPHLRG